MTDTPDEAELGKRVAAEAAIRLVESGMRLGLGTGSTMRHAIPALALRVREEGLRVVCVSTSLRTEAQARECGLVLADEMELEPLDLAIDGADEIEPATLDLVKGLGGALLREKIVAAAAARFVVVADGSKLVPALGTRAPVPVEVAAFGHGATARRLRDQGLDPALRRDGANGAYRTDGGNVIYDCRSPGPIDDPAALQARLKSLVGVVETGLFPRMACLAYVAEGRHLRILQHHG